MIRLFVGLALPPELAARLAELPRGLPNARLIEPENIHLTLRFIGEIDEARAADVDEALAAIRAPAFDLTLRGVGLFGKGHQARALWVGVDDGPDLIALQGKVEAACVHAGLPPEGRRFSPHVTIARIKDPSPPRLQAFIDAHGLSRFPPAPVDRFVLFSSLLSDKGARYAAEADYPLIACAAPSLGLERPVR